MKYQPTKIKDVCSYDLFNRIKNHALGDIHRLNAGSADCYAFNIDADGKDWQGGWDWSSNLVDTEADYILMLDTHKILKVIN